MNKLVLLILSLGLVLGGCNGQGQETLKIAAETKRTIASGEVVGFKSENGAHVWRGVPYAADTSGENRWRAPRPVAPWAGTREVISFAPACPQIATPFTPVEGFVNGRVEGSEDCLAMDIYAPADAAGKNLPVMVWIHGGSNVSGTSQLYVGDQLAINEDVIVASVQYRLGPLGWFSHADLVDSAQTPEDASANFGILDLIASLKWVRENIEVFGGDPENITIFGESAGGQNVSSLLASPLAKGLFHRAIIQSGGFDSVSIAEARGDAGDQPNPSNEVAARLGGFQKFHSVTLDEVFAAFERDGGGFMELPRIIEDGVVLPATPLRDAFASTDSFNNVPIITGTNRDEMKLFYLFNDQLTKKILGTFYVARDQDLYDAAAEYSGRVWRIRAVDRPAALMAAAGHDQVYAYRFDWDEGGRVLWMDLSKVIGAAHAIEIPFVFNRYAILGDADRYLFQKKTFETREILSRAMGAYWASFAREGVPINSGGAVWPIYGEAASVMYLDSINDAGIRVVDGADTLELIIADLRADLRVDDAQRCQIADGIVEWVPSMETAFIASFQC